MNYTGKKFSAVEAAAIQAQARAHIQMWRADNTRRHDEGGRRRDGVGRFVTKTTHNDNARVADAPPQQTDTQTAWVEWVNGRIEEKCNTIVKVCGAASGKLWAAIDRRDDEIKSLRRELRMLRDEVGLERGLAALKGEVKEARRQQPSFEAELTALREKVAKQEKTITRLRGEASQLAYRQQQLDSQQQKNKHEISVTAVKVTSIGSATREILEGLRQDGSDWLGEMPTLAARPGLLS